MTAYEAAAASSRWTGKGWGGVGCLDMNESGSRCGGASCGPCRLPPSFSGEEINKLFSDNTPPSPEGRILDRDPLEAIPYIVDAQQGKLALERCISEPQKVMYGSDGE